MDIGTVRGEFCPGGFARGGVREWMERRWELIENFYLRLNTIEEKNSNDIK